MIVNCFKKSTLLQHNFEMGKMMLEELFITDAYRENNTTINMEESRNNKKDTYGKTNGDNIGFLLGQLGQNSDYFCGIDK